MTTPVDTVTPRGAGYAPTGRTLTMLALAAILVNAQNYTVIPLLPLFAADWRTDLSAVTWMSSAVFAGYAAGFLLIGPLATRFDRRRLMVGGLVATGVLTLLVPLAGGLGTGIALRVAQGFAAATFAPAAFAYISARVAPHRRTLALSVVVSGFLAAAVVGQIGAQLLAPYGWRSVFFVSAALFGGLAALVHGVLPADPAVATGSLGGAYRSMPGLLTNRRLASLYAATLTNLGVFVAAYAGLQISGAVDGDQLLGLRASALPAIVAMPLLAVWLRRIPARLRAAGSAFVAAAAAAVVALVRPGTLGIALLLLVFVAAVATGATALNETIGQRAGEQRGTAIPLFTFVLMVGAAAAPPVAGVLAGAGLGPLFAGIAAISLTGGLFVLLARPYSATGRP